MGKHKKNGKWFFIIMLLIIFLSSPNYFIDAKNEKKEVFNNIIIVAIDNTGDYTSLIDAVNHASDGDIIRIYNGHYGEAGWISKRLTFLGNGTDNTFITSQSYYPFYCNQVPTRVENISFDLTYSPVTVVDGDGTIINNCDFNGYRGIIVENSKKYTIENCVFSTQKEAITIYAGCLNGRLINNKIYSENNVFGLILDTSETVMRNNHFINCTIGRANVDIDFSKLDADGSNTINDLPFFVKNDSKNVIVPDACSLVFLSNCENIFIENHSIDFYFKEIKIKSSNSIFINNSRFYRNIWTGIYGEYLNEVNFHNVTFSGLSGKGIMLKQSNFVKIDDSYFENNMLSMDITGDDIIISNNRYIGTNNQIAISIGLSSAPDPNERLNISNNVITGLGAAIYADDCEFIKISNNKLEDGLTGMYLSWIHSLYLSNNSVANFDIGISYIIPSEETENSIIDNNDIISCNVGIKGEGNCLLRRCRINDSVDVGLQLKNKLNKIEKCVISNTTNGTGVVLNQTYDSVLYNNIIKDNFLGINLLGTNNNLIYHNYFINNERSVESNGDDDWYKPYPIGGNYWADYTGKDVKQGSSQDKTGSDGFGDTSYSINSDQWDRYPIFIDRIKPLSKIGPDVTINEGQIVHFDGTKSMDDQMVTEYLWEFDYDKQEKNIYLDLFDFLFNIPGFYPVKLTVFDFAGNDDTDLMNVTVLDLTPPIIIHQGNISLFQGETAYFNASGSRDNDEIANYLWRITEEDKWITDLIGPSPNFEFTNPGLFEVGLIVRDRSGNEGKAFFFVNVTDIINPVADAGDDLHAINGDIVTFDGTGSNDNYWRSIKFNWSFGYNRQTFILQGSNPEFIFDIPGYYDILLKVTDWYGNSDTDTVRLIVEDTIDPEAIISGSLIILEGEGISLNGLSSKDNGQIIKYEWKFTDEVEESIEGPYLNYTFKERTEAVITMTVFDEWNNSGSAQATVVYSDTIPPVAIAGDDITVDPGTTITLDGSRSWDNIQIIKWEWNFEYDGQLYFLEGEKVNFTFDIIGIFQITLTVFDNAGYQGEDDLQINVMWGDDIMDDDSSQGGGIGFSIPFILLISITLVSLVVFMVIFIIIKRKKKETPYEKEEGKPLEDIQSPYISTSKEDNLPPESKIINEISNEEIFNEYSLPIGNVIGLRDKAIKENLSNDEE